MKPEVEDALFQLQEGDAKLLFQPGGHVAVGSCGTSDPTDQGPFTGYASTVNLKPLKDTKCYSASDLTSIVNN